MSALDIQYDTFGMHNMSDAEYTTPITHDHFKETLGRTSIVVINFYAPWCHWCDQRKGSRRARVAPQQVLPPLARFSADKIRLCAVLQVVRGLRWRRCQRLEPTWEKVSQEVHKRYPEVDGRIRFAKVGPYEVLPHTSSLPSSCEETCATQHFILRPPRKS